MCITAATVSLPPTIEFYEDDGDVQVCAELTIASQIFTAIVNDIDLTLVANEGMQSDSV